MEETRGEKTEPREEKRVERFVCIYCAYIWKTTDYSDPEDFRRGYKKIKARCPLCNVETEKPIISY